MTTLNDYLYVSKTIPETPDVNRLELTEPSTVKTTASEIKFFKDGADTEDGEVLGKITFYGKDSTNNETQFGEITGSINESDNTDEAGILELKVAESNGSSSTITTGLKLTGKKDTGGIVDVELGSATSSTTDVKGSLTINNPLSVAYGGTGAATADAARTSLGVDAIFNTISVSGQTDVVADSSTDTLTLVGGSNMTITTDASSDTITFASSGGGASTSSSNSFSETQTIQKNIDDEFIALKLQNKSDADDTTGKVSIMFNLEDTSGSDADAGKISVVKNQSFTSDASTQDSTMEFYSALDGGLVKVCDFTSDQHVDIQGGLKIGLGGLDYGAMQDGLGRRNLFIQSTHGGSGDTSEHYGWWIGAQNGEHSGGSTAQPGDNELYFEVKASTSSGGTRTVGYINDARTNDDELHHTHDKMNFTGQHRCFINNELSDMIGLLVSSTGVYVNVDNSILPTINESLPICQLSTLTNDKSVFGVVSEKEDTNSIRKYKPSNFVSVYPKTNTNERRYHINSIGEGSIWITNKNDNLQNGDYITTSTIPGYGQKQTETELHNFTVAKITCSCNFSITKINKRKVKVIVSDSSQTLDLDSSGNIQFEDDLDSDGNQQQVYPFETRFLLADGTQITETEYTTRLTNNESVYIACFVGCTYHCG